MYMSSDLFVGNKTMFRYTLNDQDGAVVDVSSASTKQITFRSPHGTTYTYNASFYTDGSDGIVQYRFTIPSPAGIWKASVYIAGVSGFSGYSETDTFHVLNIIS